MIALLFGIYQVATTGKMELFIAAMWLMEVGLYLVFLIAYLIAKEKVY